MIVGICGSPRKKATEYVFSKALHMLAQRGFETAFFTVSGKQIGFCTHCDYCLTHQECVLKDDMDVLYPLLTDATGPVIASPVYNGGVSAQIKAIMDRCRALVAADNTSFQKKYGTTIAVGGDRIGGQELVLQQIIAFHVLNGVIPISGAAFGANLGASFWSKDTLDDVKTDVEGFRSLRKTTKRFAEVLKTAC